MTESVICECPVCGRQHWKLANRPPVQPHTLGGMIAAIYADLDAEDCARIDREWMKFRGISDNAERDVATHELLKEANGLRYALNRIESIIATHERALLLPDAAEIKKIWNIAVSGLMIPPTTPDQEPVAWMCWFEDGTDATTHKYLADDWLKRGRKVVPLYSVPPEEKTQNDQY
jgi:hypothetical protein